MDEAPTYDDSAPDDTGRRIDWRSRTSTAGLVIGSAMIGLERVLFPEKRKADTEQVTNEPLDKWPRLRFDNPELDDLGPDEDGYWPS